MKKKRLLTILLCVSIFTACGKENINTEKQTEHSTYYEQSETESENSEIEISTEPDRFPDILEYVDARGMMHTLNVQKNWPMNSFDKEAFQKDGEKMKYISSDNTVSYRLGVDVSRYDGKINWNNVKEDGYEFVFVRIGFRGYGSSGTLKEDATAIKNIKGALDAGLEVGVYFFSQAINENEAIEEAKFTLKILNKAGVSPKEITLPVVFDPESILDDDARTDNVTGEQFTKNAVAFLEEIEEAGYKGMIYSNLIWESEMLDLNILKNYPIWYADYELNPQTPYEFEYWQYTEKGKVKGISTEVDINIQLIK